MIITEGTYKVLIWRKNGKQYS